MSWVIAHAISAVKSETPHADLATICANHIQPTNDLAAFTMITTPTPLQRRAFELLGVSHRHGYP
jgi:hypothetical protein